MPFLVGGGKTFKPAKKAVPGSRRFDLHKHAEATLGAGNLSEAVRLQLLLEQFAALPRDDESLASCQTRARRHSDQMLLDLAVSWI